MTLTHAGQIIIAVLCSYAFLGVWVIGLMFMFDRRTRNWPDWDRLIRNHYYEDFLLLGLIWPGVLVPHIYTEIILALNRKRLAIQARKIRANQTVERPGFPEFLS